MWFGDVAPIVGEPTIFRSRQGALAEGGAIWLKPPGISAVYIYALSAAGGGGGAGVSTGTTGPGGGGPGGQVKVRLAAINVPDALEVIVGRGGAGGVGASAGTGNAGSAGGDTLVLALNSRQTLFDIPGGGAGPIGVNLSGPSGAVTPATYFLNLGPHDLLQGFTGGGAASPGSSTTGGNVVNWPMGGAGGCTIPVATAGNGGTGTGFFTFPSAAGGVAPGGRGGDGYTLYRPIFISCPGGGGASNTTGDGGRGGDGGIACGGGGGGVGGAVFSGGAGGSGGDGIVMIWAY